MAFITPAHLCDQWQRELREKFAIDSVIVQPSQIARLERDMPRQDVSIFAHYPNFVGSIDFLKSERHRAALLRDAPDLIIVDEAISPLARAAFPEWSISDMSCLQRLRRTRHDMSSW